VEIHASIFGLKLELGKASPHILQAIFSVDAPATLPLRISLHHSNSEIAADIRRHRDQECDQSQWGRGPNCSFHVLHSPVASFLVAV